MIQGRCKVWKSGGAHSTRWGQCVPLVEIGLSYLPKSEGAMEPPITPGRQAPTALSWMGELRRRFKHSSRRLCAAPSDPGGYSVLPGGGCGEHPVSLNIKDVWHGTLKHTSILKVNSVQEACAKCFADHILEFETLQTTWKNKTRSIKMLDLLMKNGKLRVIAICKISHFNMWAAKHLAQASCTELTWQG